MPVQVEGVEVQGWLFDDEGAYEVLPADTCISCLDLKPFGPRLLGHHHACDACALSDLSF